MSNERDSKVVYEGYRGRHVFYAFLGGAAVGAITALLTAPASGAETRARLRAAGEKGREKARHLPEAIKAATIAAEEAFVAALESAQPEKRLEVAPRHREPSHRHSVS
jgi:gas vesicle protein